MPVESNLPLYNYMDVFHIANVFKGSYSWEDDRGESNEEIDHARFVLPQWPEQISDSIQSSFVETNALSRSAPVFSYINSGPRTVEISLQLHRDMMYEANYTNNTLPKITYSNDKTVEDYVDLCIRCLQAAALPNYNKANREVVPPMVAIRFGSEVYIKGIINGGVAVEYHQPLLGNGKYAVVNVSFKISEIEPQTADGIIANGSFRNITRSFKDGSY